jgi:hypothetical protein
VPTVKFMIGLQSQPNKIHLKHFSVCSLTQIWNDLGHYIEILFIISYQNDMVFTIHISFKKSLLKLEKQHEHMQLKISFLDMDTFVFMFT